MLIDSTSGYRLLSFIDRISGYNQINVELKYAKKTVPYTFIGNFYYIVMFFTLKNTGATCQRAMTAIFYEIMGEEVEDYVNDLRVKSPIWNIH